MIGSLCSGYGGLDLALMQHTGLPVAWHAEVDKHACHVLEARWPHVPNVGDITTADWTRVEPVEWVTAGYPCQPFSHAGKRKGSADERHLWPAVAHAVSVLRPRHVLLENVAGHVSLGLNAVLADLAALGYDARWGVVRAADAGAPHGRARVFIVATDTGPERSQRRRVAGIVGSASGSAPCAAEQRERHGDAASHCGAAATPDADLAGGETRSGRPGARDARRLQPVVGSGPVVEWGAYTPAIRRWEHVTGRPAPRPTEPGRNGERLSPRFVEWLMGLPDGWVTAVPIPRNAQLKCLGNGVVPQQALLALRMLTTQEAAA